MLVFDVREIGNKLLKVRKKAGLTQAEVAELSGLSDRTYADIERGSANMRVETLQRICQTLHITPDEVLTEENTDLLRKKEEVFAELSLCAQNEQETALALLTVYLHSLRHPS